MSRRNRCKFNDDCTVRKPDGEMDEPSNADCKKCGKFKTRKKDRKNKWKEVKEQEDRKRVKPRNDFSTIPTLPTVFGQQHNAIIKEERENDGDSEGA